MRSRRHQSMPSSEAVEASVVGRVSRVVTGCMRWLILLQKSEFGRSRPTVDRVIASTSQNVSVAKAQATISSGLPLPGSNWAATWRDSSRGGMPGARSFWTSCQSVSRRAWGDPAKTGCPRAGSHPRRMASATSAVHRRPSGLAGAARPSWSAQVERGFRARARGMQRSGPLSHGINAPPPEQALELLSMARQYRGISGGVGLVLGARPSSSRFTCSRLPTIAARSSVLETSSTCVRTNLAKGPTSPPAEADS